MTIKDLVLLVQSYYFICGEIDMDLSALFIVFYYYFLKLNSTIVRMFDTPSSCFEISYSYKVPKRHDSLNFSKV